MVASAAQRGKNIVISDTNLNNKLVNQLVKFVEECGFVVEWKDFTDVPLEVCLGRDKSREFPVGASVIKRQYYKYIMKNEFYREPYLKPQDVSLPKAVIFDVDGTLTLGPKDRSPYDMSKVLNDEPNLYTFQFLNLFLNNTDTTVFIFSGREKKSKDDTLQWILRYVDATAFKKAVDSERVLFVFREDDNSEGDDKLKDRFFNTHVQNNYHVVAVFDDRLRVCKMWKEKGLPLFRVGDPEADF